MKLIKPQASLLQQPEGLEGVYKQIEICGRTCYKSLDKMTENSAKGFVERMIKSNHTAMLEHGTIYLQCRLYLNEKDETPLSKYKVNKYSKCYEYYFPASASKGSYVTTNLRVLQENNWLDDLQYICEPTEFHEKRYTFKLTTSIGVTREIIRHRNFSFAEQSTRYCNFSKDKFDNQVTFCIPSWIDIPAGIYHTTAHLEPEVRGTANSLWFNKVSSTNDAYMTLIQEGWQPQEAREVLPLCTASELIITGFLGDYKHFFDLRLFNKTGKAHPNMIALAQLMRTEFEKANLWDKIYY